MDTQKNCFIEYIPYFVLEKRIFESDENILIIIFVRGTGLPGLNQYKARVDVLAQGPQHSDFGEARIRGPSVSSQAICN